jgi:hypothetical protein
MVNAANRALEFLIFLRQSAHRWLWPLVFHSLVRIVMAVGPKVNMMYLNRDSALRGEEQNVVFEIEIEIEIFPERIWYFI